MQNLEHFINSQNAAHAIRYLLNLDLNALNEKTIRLGFTNIVDIQQAKKLCCSVFLTDDTSSSRSEHLVQQAIEMSRTLNEEARQNMMEYLAVQKNISI